MAAYVGTVFRRHKRILTSTGVGLLGLAGTTSFPPTLYLSRGDCGTASLSQLNSAGCRSPGSELLMMFWRLPEPDIDRPSCAARGVEGGAKLGVEGCFATVLLLPGDACEPAEARNGLAGERLGAIAGRRDAELEATAFGWTRLRMTVLGCDLLGAGRAWLACCVGVGVGDIALWLVDAEPLRRARSVRDVASPSAEPLACGPDTAPGRRFMAAFERDGTMTTAGPLGVR